MSCFFFLRFGWTFVRCADFFFLLLGAEKYRVGAVELLSTPPMVLTEHRASYTVQASSDDMDAAPNNGEEGSRHEPPSFDSADRREEEAVAPVSLRPRADSGLLGPTSALTRSSTLTMSSTSRISGLSDFPVPPLIRNGIASDPSLSYYFDGAHSVRASGESMDVALPSSSALDGGHYVVRRRVEDGIASDITPKARSFGR